MFIQTEPTPNPDTVKFLPGLPVAGDLGPFDFPDIGSARMSLLARALFQVDGVDRVFLGSDFVSINKDPDRDWKHVKPMVLAAIMDHFMAGLPVVEDGAVAASSESGDDTVYEGDAAEIVEEIKELIETRVRPAVAQDGGDIIFHRFEPDTGIVHLSMRGACAGCPSSTMTLKQGIENMLKTYVPEVTAVEAVL
ncbi:MAG: NifU family protein [Alphaproteobacteria bacterium]|mgnify:FL=1|uniref:NifU family protein n=1 Tax=Hyphomonas sp. TaxID=87 RepID=UPI001D6EBBAE|nr:NifU family protein [Alphaproteobacteria bacterium]MBU2084082.1 NifU family protein [Alphaproteobacteria bacterium]MBU2144383.1 NifU family protein [Alphaproteobacteria bacterium]MBU2196359.1 NifU family protein [Alphaproteobacteria bacterium]|tara:strand:+ start:15729 stop:16310 length:582 start_codon:yes stop_codon:yes gene_type:complete